MYLYMSTFVTVSDAADLVGVSPDTIRRWNKKGLIKAKRSELNHRLFNVGELKLVSDKVSGKFKGNHYKVLKTNRKTKYKVVELFAGAGGTAIGLENAGLGHVLLVENDKNAVATLKKNRPEWNIDERDIADVDFKKIKADVVEGGFPCQAFSYAGNKRGFDDTRGTLFFEFARSVREIRPKIAVGENVRGLHKHDGGRTLETMVKVLKDLGYKVTYRVLRSQYLDTPQKRERLIILAVRKDLDLPFIFPKEKNYTVSLREALENCPESDGQRYPERKEYILSKVPPGGYWRDLPLDLQKEYMGGSFYLGGGKTGMARRLSWDEPSLTLTCSPAQKQTERCHPEETRPLNVREYARIQVFPDSWKFEGSTASQYKQIGNALPTNVAFHMGRCLIAMLEKNPDPKTMEVVDEPGQKTLI